ncbi:MAG: hypothetical protein F6K35_04100 [Okeania sp. SIO2H7]|nr:hypothetical protein [Okeania sp. SIO2H7]
MPNGIGLDRKTEQINETALELERVKSFLESCIAPNSFSDEIKEFFRELAALKGKSVEETIQETMTGAKKYLEAVEIEITFKNDLPTDIDRYAEKLEKVAESLEFCWDILSWESRQFFINLAYNFTKVAASKLQGIKGLSIWLKLLLPSLQRQENLFEKYKYSLLLVPKAVDRATVLRQSKSTAKLQTTAELLLARAKGINTIGSSLLPYMKHFGRTPEEQLEKNQPALAWVKARLEQIENQLNSDNL